MWWRSDKKGRWSGFASFPFVGVSTVTEVVDTNGEGAALGSVPSVGVDSARHCGGGQAS
jgi:hypothetical protein